MGKGFSKAFYNSNAWKACREAYIAQRNMIDGGMCEKCKENIGEELHHKVFLRPDNIHNADITLNPENLILLCKDCHFKEHKQAILLGFRKRKKRKVLLNGMFFENGMPHQQQVNIIYGPPASGKTTYVKNNMEIGDLVIDLDYIKQAISFTWKDAESDNLLDIAIKIRDCIYEAIEKGEVDCKRVWIIAGLPNKNERERLKERFNATLIPMLKARQECVNNAKRDKRDMILQEVIIDKWFEEYTP